MKSTNVAVMIGVVVLLLGLVGLLSGEGRMLGEMNIDIALDGARIALGSMLIYAGLKSAETARNFLYLFGVVYLGMFVLGLIDPTLFGILPSGLGSIDQAIHIMGGIAAIALPLIITEPKKRGRHAT